MIPYFIIDQITLGPVKFYTGGLFVGLGFSAGYLWFYYLARKEGLAPIKIVGLALAIFIGAILGAKTLAVVLAGGGAAFMGGLAGAIICGGGFVKIVNYIDYSFLKGKKIPPNPPFLKGGAKGLNFWKIADLLVLPTLLGIGIGRVGCFLINDHQGALMNLPWGILWPDSLVRHPVGIYESLLGFGLLALFWWARKKIKSMSLRGAPLRLSGAAQRSNPVDSCNITGSPRSSGDSLATTDGFLFLLFLLSYSVLRFLLDFTRVASGPLADPRWGVLSVSQWLALGIIFIAGFYWVMRKKG